MKIEELKELREKHPKSERVADENVQEIVQHLVTNESNKPFVFISYKSDDWYIVLHEIVFILVHDYGLNVYFDGSFDDHLSLWVNQFPENMGDYNCRAVLSFRSDAYDCSYATLMEVMYSQRELCKKYVNNTYETMALIPVNLSPTMPPQKEGAQDTGLGKEYYPDGTVNNHYEGELALFKACFEEMKEKGRIVKLAHVYIPESPRKNENTLTKMKCFLIMGELFSTNKKGAEAANENYYFRDEYSKRSFFASLTTMLNNIDPQLFDSGARLKPGQPYVPDGPTPPPPPPPPPPPVYRMSGKGYDASFTCTTVTNSMNETKYKITLLKGSKVNLASHIKTGWKYDKKHRADIDENSGLLKNDIPDLATSAAECIIKGNSCSGKAVRNLIEEADTGVSTVPPDDSDTIPDDPISVNGKALHSVSPGTMSKVTEEADTGVSVAEGSDSQEKESDGSDTVEVPTGEDLGPGAQETGNVCRITGSDYDATFIYTTVINSKNETEYRITLLKGSRVKLASHMKTGWKYDKNHRADIDENSGLLKNDIPDLAISAAECIIKGNSCSGKAIRILIEEAESKET